MRNRATSGNPCSPIDNVAYCCASNIIKFCKFIISISFTKQFAHFYNLVFGKLRPAVLFTPAMVAVSAPTSREDDTEEEPPPVVN